MSNKVFTSKIGIDIDNVISESYPKYLENFNRQFDMQVSIEEITDFYYLDKIKNKVKLKHIKKAVNYVDELILDEKFQLNLPPTEGAVEVIGKIARRGFQIHYVTARPIKVRNITLQWLKKHGYWLTGARLDLYDENKNYPSDIEYKIGAVTRYGLSVFIEDNLEIAKAMPIPVFLFDWPWNRSENPENVIRVKTWKEIERKLLND